MTRALALPLASCGNRPRPPAHSLAPSDPAETITDSLGRSIGIPEKIESAVIFSTAAYTMLRVLGVEHTITGAGEHVVTRIKGMGGHGGIENFGLWNNPSVEKLITARPDLVIAYGTFTPVETMKQLEAANITVAFFDLYMPRRMDGEMLALGRLYRKEAKAQEYADFLNSYKRLIAERTERIPLAARARVYWEGYSDFSTVSNAAQSAGELIADAACVNIASHLSAPYPKVSGEWILEANPDIIIKNSAAAAGIAGQEIHTRFFAQKEYERLGRRAGWQNLRALKNKKFLILASEIAVTPEGSAAGALIIAKTAYPERFADIDPLAVYEEIRRRFLRAEGPAGVLVHPWEYP
ncbi:MAG: ABC transporter substrate-binding protein [Treponema sp.]|nr:ABC transporter substrate-binding protein [Treponema sp.]